MTYEVEYESILFKISTLTGLNVSDIKTTVEKLAEKLYEDRLVTAMIISSFSQSVFTRKNVPQSASTVYPIWMQLYQSMRIRYIDQGALVSIAEKPFERTHQEMYAAFSEVHAAVKQRLLTFTCSRCKLRLPLGLDVKYDITHPVSAYLSCIYCHNEKVMPQHVDLTLFIQKAKIYQEKSEDVVLILSCIPSWLYTKLVITESSLRITCLKTEGELQFFEEVKNCFHLIQNCGFECQFDEEHVIFVAI